MLGCSTYRQYEISIVFILGYLTYDGCISGSVGGRLLEWNWWLLVYLNWRIDAVPFQTCQRLLLPIGYNAPRIAALLKQILDHVRYFTYIPIIPSEDIPSALLLLAHGNVKTLVLTGCWEFAGRHTTRSHPFIQLSMIMGLYLPFYCRAIQLKLDRHVILSFKIRVTVLNAPPKLLSFHVPTILVGNKWRPDELPLLDLSGLQSLTIQMTTNLNRLCCIGIVILLCNP